MSDAIVIRAMRPDDLVDVLAIEHVAYSTPWPESSFRGLLDRDDADLFIAEIGGEVAGYAVCWAVLEQGELGNIAVSPRWRRRGVATRLLSAVIEAMRDRGVVELFLEVRLSNDAAQQLYRRFGFREVGRRRGYYTSPVEDALVMRREIERPGTGPSTD
jgi:ribosomal-protein-alanine N-acetyltransferase